MNHESLAISKRSFLKALAKGALATGLLGPRSSKGATTYKPRPQALLTTDIREPSDTEEEIHFMSATKLASLIRSKQISSCLLYTSPSPRDS